MNKIDLLNEKIYLEEFFQINFCIIIIFIILLFNYLIYKYVINNQNKYSIILLIILIIFIIIVIINKQLLTNVNYTTQSIDISKEDININTGDLVLFRCYYNTTLSDLLFYKFLLPLLQKTYFTHIGIIYKSNDGQIYILESHGDNFFCELNQINKNGVIMQKLSDRITNTTEPYRIHLIKTNLHTKINQQKFNNSIIKYKNYVFNQDGLNCVNYIAKILEENELFYNNKLFFTPDSFLDTNNYNYDFKIEDKFIIKELL